VYCTNKLTAQMSVDRLCYIKGVGFQFYIYIQYIKYCLCIWNDEPFGKQSWIGLTKSRRSTFHAIKTHFTKGTPEQTISLGQDER
jgi:hypothetical protein